ncbi:hypothetical protein EV363DRAFT_1437630 [Boletus edulis]|nr:hypothetical protein EV363DRAFT_1437630 [Boletus edulis]
MASVPSNDPSFADIVTVQMLESIRTTRTLGNFDDTRNYCWVKDMTAEALMHQWLNKLDNEKRCKIGKLPVMHHWPVDASAGGRGIGNDRHVNRHDASASTERVEAVGHVRCVVNTPCGTLMHHWRIVWGGAGGGGACGCVNKCAVLMHHLAGRRAVDGQGWAEYVNASLAHHLAMWRAAGERAGHGEGRMGRDGQNMLMHHWHIIWQSGGQRESVRGGRRGSVRRRMGKGGQNMLMHHWRIIWGGAGGGGACGTDASFGGAASGGWD